MKLTIIIPCYNEEKTISVLLKKILNLSQFKKQIIVVDDCSTDNSLREIEKVKNTFKDILVIKHTNNQGKGAAIKSSQEFITGNVVIIQDADLEYDPQDIPSLVDPIYRKDYLVVYGSRILGKKYFENLKNFSHWIRILGNLILTKFSNLINKQKLTDAHTCYKAFDADLFKKLELKEKNFNFCPEVTTKISNQGVEIYELPINYKGRDYDEGKKIKFIDALKAVNCIIKYKFF
tara:strand:+ start:99 stop:800 length:702 start_codon:yes stop_codon:yes gene_type:complete